jgi:hypothetical protein
VAGHGHEVRIYPDTYTFVVSSAAQPPHSPQILLSDG